MKPGDTLGRYEIKVLLARGGMAEVYLALSKGVGGFQKNVVLKMILPELAENPDFVRMFINEALLAARLNHPNIVQIFDLGHIDDKYYIAMEYVPGRSMRQISRVCRRKGELIRPWFVLHTMAKVCDGLQFAHDYCDEVGKPLGLVHRDVTPENIMVSGMGNVKILDFGVAKATSAATLTKAGTLKGKYAYIAPEQIHGLPVDRRIDIYAVGVILYELLTGYRPFWGSNDLELLRKVAEGNPPPPSKHASWIPNDLEAIIMKALAFDLKARYAEAEHLAEDIMQFLLRAEDKHTQRDRGAFVSALFAEDPILTSDMIKRRTFQTDPEVGEGAPLHRPSGSEPSLEGAPLEVGSTWPGTAPLEGAEDCDNEDTTKKSRTALAVAERERKHRSMTINRSDASAFDVTGLEGWEYEERSLPSTCTAQETLEEDTQRRKVTAEEFAAPPVRPPAGRADQARPPSGQEAPSQGAGGVDGAKERAASPLPTSPPKQPAPRRSRVVSTGTSREDPASPPPKDKKKRRWSWMKFLVGDKNERSRKRTPLTRVDGPAKTDPGEAPEARPAQDAAAGRRIPARKEVALRPEEAFTSPPESAASEPATQKTKPPSSAGRARKQAAARTQAAAAKAQAAAKPPAAAPKAQAAAKPPAAAAKPPAAAPKVQAAAKPPAAAPKQQPTVAKQPPAQVPPGKPSAAKATPTPADSARPSPAAKQPATAKAAEKQRTKTVAKAGAPPQAAAPQAGAPPQPEPPPQAAAPRQPAKRASRVRPITLSGPRTAGRMPSPADVRAEAAKADQAHETAKAKADAADEAAGSPEPTLQPRSSHPSWQLPKPSTSPSKRKPERRVSQVLGRYLDEAPSQGEAFDTSPSPPGASPPSATSDVLPSEPAPAEAPDTLGIVEQSSASRGPLGSDAMAAVWETAASKRQGPFDTTEPGEEAEAKQDEAAEGGGVEPDPIWGTGTSRAWGEPSDQAGAEERLLVETMKPARLPDPDIHSPAGFPTRSGPIQEERLSPDVFLSSRPTIAHDADDDIFTSFTRVKLERVQENPFATIEQRTVEEVVERVVDRVTDRVTDRGGKEEPAAERRSRDVWQPTAPVENEAARHFEEGLDLMRSGRYEEALEKWKAAISLEPGNRTYQSNIRRLKRMMESGDEPRW